MGLGTFVMSLKRLALAVSSLALLAAWPAIATEVDAWPAPPEPAEINLAIAPDATAEPDIAQLMPPAVEAAQVVLDEPARPADDASLLAGFPSPPELPPLAAELIAPPLRLASEGTSDQPVEADSMLAALPPLPEPPPLAADLVAPPADSASVVASITPATPIVEAPPTIGSTPAQAEVAVAPPSEPAAPSIELAAPAEPRPVPAPAVASISQDEIASALAQLVAEAARHPRLPAAESEALIRFYAARDHRPLWTDGQGFAAPAASLRSQLARAVEDGLRSADYRTDEARGDAAALALADIRLSVTAVLYARDARGGRLDPRRLSGLITPRLFLPGAEEVLAGLAAAGSHPGEALAGYNPQHEGYKLIKAKLADHRRDNALGEPMVRLPVGPPLRVGMRDQRVPLIRARLGVSPGDSVYDGSLSTVVAEFQRDNGLPSNGILNRATIDALNGSGARGLEADLIAVMERWRWLPPELGEEHVIVNVPEYIVRKVEGGQVVHQSRAIVGKPERPTPIFSHEMDHLVLNPSWTVPPTILRKDILPKLESDPGYAERRGLTPIRRGDRIVGFRQPPGPSNALGNIKFMFPNDHAVYLHDTPNRGLFNSSRRAQSSGCVRVERPMRWPSSSSTTSRGTGPSSACAGSSARASGPSG